MSQLIECITCKKLISQNAKACPNCGEENSQKLGIVKSVSNLFRLRKERLEDHKLVSRDNYMEILELRIHELEKIVSSSTEDEFNENIKEYWIYLEIYFETGVDHIPKGLLTKSGEKNLQKEISLQCKEIPKLFIKHNSFLSGTIYKCLDKAKLKECFIELQSLLIEFKKI